MRFSLIGLLFMSFPLFAAEPLSLKNDREGETFYSSRSDKRAISKALKQLDQTYIDQAFNEVLSETEASKVCSFDINANLQKKLRERDFDFNEMQGAILYLRSQNHFDDVVTKQLLDAHKTQTTYVSLPKRFEDLSYPSDKTLNESLSILKNFEKKAKTICFDEAYRTLYGDIIRVDKHLSSSQIAGIFAAAAEQKLISQDTYVLLEKGRMSELENGSLTLKAYVSKIRSLRTQFPLRDPNEKSNFVTGKVDKLKVSRRQKLLENYTDLQIMLMANVIKKLRTRVEAPRAEILIFDRNNEVETITLEPMERFRLAIKLLRKEMSLLALNTYFNGRAPDYMDLMTAAYETGIIPASELEEVAGLQEIWNPSKTFWQKAEVWVRLASSVATIALPPPYGFIPALAVVVIEMTAGKKDQNTNDPTVLF